MAELKAYNPTLSDQLKWGIFDALSAMGMGRYAAQDLSKAGTTVAEMLPVSGNILAGSQMEKDKAEGNWTGAGLSAAGAALPIPAAGKVAKTMAPSSAEIDKALKAIADALGMASHEIVPTNSAKIKSAASSVHAETAGLNAVQDALSGAVKAENATTAIQDALNKPAPVKASTEQSAEEAMKAIQDVLSASQFKLTPSAIEQGLVDNPGASIADLAGFPQAFSPKKPAIIPSASADALAYENEVKRSPEFIQPYDWKDFRPEYLDPKWAPQLTGILGPETVGKMGFNLEAPLFKGGHMQNYPTRLPNPLEKGSEQALFFSDNPEIAKSYGKPMSYVVRSPNTGIVDWKEATGGRKHYNDDFMDELVGGARKQGLDMLVLKGLFDVGSPALQNQFAVLNTPIVRRPDAAFNPNKLHLNDLLAGLGGFGLLAPALAGSNDNKQ